MRQFLLQRETQRGDHTLAECKGSDGRFTPLNHYISIANMFKISEVIICTGASFADDWKSMDPESSELLQSLYILEQMPAGKKLVLWPRCVDVPAEDGFFTVVKTSCPGKTGFSTS